MPLAVHERTFFAAPVRSADDPVAILLAVYEAPGLGLLIPIPDPCERAGSLSEIPGTLPRPGHGRARLGGRTPSVTPRPLGNLLPACHAGRLAGARFIGADSSCRVGRYAILRGRGSARRRRPPPPCRPCPRTPCLRRRPGRCRRAGGRAPGRRGSPRARHAAIIVRNSSLNGAYCLAGPSTARGRSLFAERRCSGCLAMSD